MDIAQQQTQLIEAAQRGSVSAFERLLQGVEKQMLGVAAGLAPYPDEADDILQEAMFNAYKALPKFRLDRQFSAWLYRIFVNTTLGHRRKLSTKLSRLMSPDNENAYTGGESYLGPEHEASNKQLNREINRALTTLSNNERVAFVLCHQQELSIVEAGRIMECRHGAVKSYLFRAREKRRKQLQHHKR
ncbi:MAG: RNA polymerase sigma-70 factor (ECF subfamily) [Lentisphaeria bacterium]